MRTNTAKRKFRPGELAPITGIYTVTHGDRHRERHEVVVIRGEQLPTCRDCKLNVFFEIQRPVSHITHDWDFSGPYNLVVRPPHEDTQEFRMFRRAQVQLPIKVRLNGVPSLEVIQGHTSDLSAGGLGAVIRSELPLRYKGETLRLSIERGRDSVSLQARLRYQNGLRHGFEFINVSEAERDAIRRLITKRKLQVVAASH